MSAWGWCLATVAALLAFCFGAYVGSRNRRDEIDRLITQTHDDAYADGLLDGNVNASNKAAARLDKIFGNAPMRYELVINDWGAEHGDMRWRWTIWEADRYFDLALWPTEVDDDEPGTVVPYMLGNEPTRALAEAKALAWIADNPIEALEREQDFERTMKHVEGQMNLVLGR